MIRILLILLIGTFFSLPQQAMAQFSSLKEDVPTLCPIPENGKERVCEINICIRTGFTGKGCGSAFGEFVCRLSPFCGGSPLPLPDECLCTWIPDVLITPQKLGLPSTISLEAFKRAAQNEISSQLNSASDKLLSQFGGMARISTCTSKKIRLKGKDDSCKIETGFSTMHILKDRKSRKKKIYELTVMNIPHQSLDLPAEETLIRFEKGRPTFCQVTRDGVVTSMAQDCISASNQFPPVSAADDREAIDEIDDEVDFDDSDFNQQDYDDDFPNLNPGDESPIVDVDDPCINDTANPSSSTRPQCR